MSTASHGLPGVLGEIADLVGIEAALAVADKVGGSRAYVSKKPGPDNWLVVAVGPELAAKIAEHFSTGRGGIELDFPAGPAGSYNSQRRERRRQLKELTARGLSNVEVARQAKITERAVQMFRARQRAAKDSDQGGFEF